MQFFLFADRGFLDTNALSLPPRELGFRDAFVLVGFLFRLHGFPVFDLLLRLIDDRA
jgi:hypothetical protein